MDTLYKYDKGDIESIILVELCAEIVMTYFRNFNVCLFTVILSLKN